jgi:hypothetical protein
MQVGLLEQPAARPQRLPRADRTTHPEGAGQGENQIEIDRVHMLKSISGTWETNDRRVSTTRKTSDQFSTDEAVYRYDTNGKFQLDRQLSSKQWRDLPREGTQYCDLKAPDFLSKINDDYIFITHSLGSRITTDALQRIFEYTKGIPRRINQVCTTALMAGLIDQKSVIDDSTIRKAIADIDHD